MNNVHNRIPGSSQPQAPYMVGGVGGRSREIGWIGYYMYVYLHEQLALTIMGAERSLDLPSASWTPSKASAVMQSEPEGQRTRGSWWAKSQSEGRRRWSEVSQGKGWGRKRRVNSFCLCLLFYLVLQQIAWCPLTLGRPSASWRALIQGLILSRNTFTGTPRNDVCLIWASCGPGVLTHKTSHHSREGSISSTPNTRTLRVRYQKTWILTPALTFQTLSMRKLQL